MALGKEKERRAYAMIEDTLSKLEARIRQLKSLDDPRKDELTELFSTLKDEVTQLSRTRRDEAESIAQFAALSAHEATRPTRNPRLQKLSIEGLEESVEGMEVSHPRLVEIVNSICVSLSNMGI
jgi:hypothetical protein